MKAMTAALLMGLTSLPACVESDDTGTVQQAEIIEVHGCRPGSWDIGDGICVDPWPGGGGGGPTGGDGGLGGPGGGGPGGGGGTFDPEPDRNKDRKSCDDWCTWNKRQCLKECRHQYPDPMRDIGARNRCITACDDARDPDHGLHECRADCQRRFPGRPITALEPAP